MKKQGKNEGKDIPGQKEKMGGSHVHLYTFLDGPHFLRGQKKTVTGSLEGRGPGEPGKQVAGCSPKQLWEASRKRCHERRWREGRQRAGCVQRPSLSGPSTGSGGGSLASVRLLISHSLPSWCGGRARPERLSGDGLLLLGWHCLAKGLGKPLFSLSLVPRL